MSSSQEAVVVTPEHFQLSEEGKKKFNWGAFVAPVLWGFTYGNRYMVFSVIGLAIIDRVLSRIAETNLEIFLTFYVYLTMSYLAGKQANSAVRWRWKKYESEQKWRRSQKVFFIIALTLFSLCAIGSLIAGMMATSGQNMIWRAQGNKSPRRGGFLLY